MAPDFPELVTEIPRATICINSWHTCNYICISLSCMVLGRSYVAYNCHQYEELPTIASSTYVKSTISYGFSTQISYSLVNLPQYDTQIHAESSPTLIEQS